MHQREVIGAGGGTLTDTLHISFAMITVLFMMILMGFGAAGLGKSFRLFTIVIFLIFIIFGALSGMESPGINANLPTPHLGIWERINIGAFMLWVIVFANALLNKEKLSGSIKGSISPEYKAQTLS
jgi:amino acid transporter